MIPGTIFNRTPVSPRFRSVLSLALAFCAVGANAAPLFPWSKTARDSAKVESRKAAEVDEARTPFDFYRIPNERLARQLWLSSGAPGTFHAGEHQVLATYPDSGSRKAYLLREGTQIAVIPDSVMERYGRSIRAGGSGMASGQKRGQASKALWQNVWNPEDPLEPYRWPTGVTASGGLSFSASPSSSVSFVREYRGDVAVSPFGFFIAEAGWRNTRHGGGLRENLLREDSDTIWRSFGPHENGWRLALGVPGLKYELFSDDRAIPEFYWLEPKAGEASYKTGQPGSFLADSMANGVLLRRWRENGKTGGPWGNVTQAVHARAGMIRYSAWFDGDLYNSAIQRVMFAELPAPFGEWGFGLTFADGAAHSRLYADLFPASFRIGPKRWDSSLRFAFVRLDLDIRSVDTFRFGASSRLSLDGPFLRPGDRR